MSARLADRCDDIIDALMVRTQGAVLRTPQGWDGGEYDSWKQGLSRRDVRRLIGAGLVAVDGETPDVMADSVTGDMNGDEFVAWYCAQALQGLDQRAARRARAETTERPEADQVDDEPIDVGETLAELAVCVEVPAWFRAWCDRTVHPPKLAALVGIGSARWLGGPTPAPLADAWYPKLVAKFETRCKG